MNTTQATTMKRLRDSAQWLEQQETDMLFPGWDMAGFDTPPPNESLTKRHQAIQNAARAILANGKSADEGTRVALKDVGCLVQYVADMLE